MANLPETPDYPAGVYQLETSDPVLGGAGGIANRQAEQLGNRTAWLKAKIDAFLDGTVAVLKATKLASSRTLSISGAGSGSASFDGSANANIALTLADSGAVAGTYPKVTVNAKGLVTGGAPLSGGDIPSNLSLAGSPSAQTPAQFDSDGSLATTEFVQRALGNFSGQSTYNASAQLTAAEAGRLVLIQAAVTTPTLTLPPAASVPVGTAFWFCGNAQNFPPIIAVQAGDSLVRPDASTGSIQMSANGTLLVRKASNGVWFASDGTDAFKYMHSLFGASLGANGYRRTPSGDIEQWGLVVAAPSGSNTVITLPTAYTVAVRNIGITFANFSNDEAVGDAPVLQARASSLGTITVRNLHIRSASFFWKTTGI